jgi:hypothetical protein
VGRMRIANEAHIYDDMHMFTGVRLAIHQHASLACLLL